MEEEIKKILTKIKTITYFIVNEPDVTANNSLKRIAKKKNISIRNDIYDLKLSDFIYNIKQLEFLINKNNKMEKIRKIKICVASSDTLMEERKEIEDYLFQKNDNLIDQGVYLQYNVWEKRSGVFSRTNKQNDFNKDLVYDSDVFICLIKDKVGKFTKKEFDEAWKNFSAGNKPRLMYIYFKNLNQEETLQLSKDKNKFSDYNKVHKLKSHISQIEQIFREFENKDGLIRLIDNSIENDLKSLYKHI